MNISNLIVVWFSSLTLRQVALSYLWNAAEKFYGLSKYPRFDFEWTKSCYVHFDIKLGLKCTDCYCYVTLVYGNYLYKKHVEFFSNTWGSSLLSNLFSRLFFCCCCYCKFFFSMLFRAFYVCRHAIVLVTVFVTKMWRDDPNITWKGG